MYQCIHKAVYLKVRSFEVHKEEAHQTDFFCYPLQTITYMSKRTVKSYFSFLVKFLGLSQLRDAVHNVCRPLQKI